MVKNSPANAGGVGSVPRLGRSPREGNGQPILIFLPEKSHGQRSLAGYSLWDHKRQQQQCSISFNLYKLRELLVIVFLQSEY